MQPKISWLLLFLCFGGCATSVYRAYDGSEKPRQEVAILKAARFYGESMFGRLSQETTIHSLNEKIVNCEQLEVLPGVYKIDVELIERYHFRNDMVSMHPLSVTVQAEAGKEYMIRGDSEKESWKVSVIEILPNDPKGQRLTEVAGGTLIPKK